MQTAKSTLKLRVPVTIVAPLLKKPVVVIEKPALRNKFANAKLTVAVKPSASNDKSQEGKASKEQIKAEKAIALAEVQKETLKAKLAKWKAEYKQNILYVSLLPKNLWL